MRWLVLAGALAACSGEGKGPDGAGGSDTAGPPTTTGITTSTGGSTTPTPSPALPELMLCHDAPLPPAVATGDWNDLASALVAVGEPGHSADDVLATDTGVVALGAKFAYGVLSTDLQGEQVEVWIDDCSGAYVLLGEATTDSDGRIAQDFPPDVLPGFGSFGLFYRVVGDGTTTTASLRLFPTGTKLLVSDIDGTLTTSDTELFVDLFSEIGSGAYVPEARADSVAAMWTRTEQGYPIAYLTGRPYWLTEITRGWLVDLAYPPGTVHLAPSNADILPTDDSVGDYKIAWLESLLDQGFVLDGAYGNAETDIFAYAGVSVALDRTWILGEFGGDGGTVDLGEDYTAHVAAIAGEPQVSQPFQIP